MARKSHRIHVNSCFVLRAAGCQSALFSTISYHDMCAERSWPREFAINEQTASVFM